MTGRTVQDERTPIERGPRLYQHAKSTLLGCVMETPIRPGTSAELRPLSSKAAN